MILIVFVFFTDKVFLVQVNLVTLRQKSLITVTVTIKELKKLRESEDKVEFKEAKKDFNFNGGNHADPARRRKCVLGYTVALANEGGGMLVLGMNDKYPHEVVGTTFEEGNTGKMEEEIYNRLDVRVKIEELFEGDKRVLVFNIPSRPIGVTLKFEGVPLMRIGDSLHVMSDNEVFRILSERAPDFSATTCEGLTFDDLDTEAIRLMKSGYAKKQDNPAFETLPDKQVLTDLGLLKDGKFNYATLILLGKREALHEYLSNAEIIIEYRFLKSNQFIAAAFRPLKVI
jgi:ATP-dependent DNA helicase RecG